MSQDARTRTRLFNAGVESRSPLSGRSYKRDSDDDWIRERESLKVEPAGRSYMHNKYDSSDNWIRERESLKAEPTDRSTYSSKERQPYSWGGQRSNSRSSSPMRHDRGSSNDSQGSSYTGRSQRSQGSAYSGRSTSRSNSPVRGKRGSSVGKRGSSVERSSYGSRGHSKEGCYGSGSERYGETCGLSWRPVKSASSHCHADSSMHRIGCGCSSCSYDRIRPHNHTETLTYNKVDRTSASVGGMTATQLYKKRERFSASVPYQHDKFDGNAVDQRALDEYNKWADKQENGGKFRLTREELDGRY